MVTIYYFIMILSHLVFEFQTFRIIFFPNISGYTNKKFKVYFIFLISVFGVFSINNLTVCHRNFDGNRHLYNCKTITTEILEINRIRYNCGEMAAITYPHFDQHYNKYIFRNNISHNLQWAEGN